ncbi:hypothetical protein [Klebsiella grimontii]|uniref:hypothetical protein n=1 Tax=Klebsiella grimontii TaxID=2058152 RepID=UPI0035A190E8
MNDYLIQRALISLYSGEAIAFSSAWFISASSGFPLRSAIPSPLPWHSGSVVPLPE